MGVASDIRDEEDLLEFSGIPIPIPGSECMTMVVYNFKESKLKVVFTDGKSDTYDVDPLTVIGLLLAESKGRYFNENIRSER